MEDIVKTMELWFKFFSYLSALLIFIANLNKTLNLIAQAYKNVKYFWKLFKYYCLSIMTVENFNSIIRSDYREFLRKMWFKSHVLDCMLAGQYDEYFYTQDSYGARPSEKYWDCWNEVVKKYKKTSFLRKWVIKRQFVLFRKTVNDDIKKMQEEFKKYKLYYGQ